MMARIDGRRLLAVGLAALAAGGASACGGGASGSDAVEGARPSHPTALALVDGSIVAVWAQRHPGSRYSVATATRGSGGGWGSNVAIAPEREWQVGGLRLATGNDGELMVAQVSGDGPRSVVEVAVRDRSGRWGRPTAVTRVGRDFTAVPAFRAGGSATVRTREGVKGTTLRDTNRSATGIWRDPQVLARFDGFPAVEATVAFADRVCTPVVFGLPERVPPRGARPADPALRIRCTDRSGSISDSPSLATAAATAVAALGSTADRPVAAWQQWSEGRGPYALMVSREVTPGRWTRPIELDRSRAPFGALVVAQGTVAWLRLGESPEVQVRVADLAVPRPTARTIDRFALQEPATWRGLEPPAPPGEIVAATDGRSLAWTVGGFPMESLVGDLRAATRAGSDTWRQVAVPVPEDTGGVRPLAVATAADGLNVVWATYPDRRGGAPEAIRGAGPLRP